MTTPNYSPPYVAEGNCLYLLAEDKRGQTRKKLCNFTPYIVQQVTKNDGADSTTWAYKELCEWLHKKLERSDKWRPLMASIEWYDNI